MTHTAHAYVADVSMCVGPCAYACAYVCAYLTSENQALEIDQASKGGARLG